MPPCKHRSKIDPKVSVDFLGKSPSVVRRGMSKGSPKGEKEKSPELLDHFPFAAQAAARNNYAGSNNAHLTASIDSSASKEMR